MVEEVAQVVGVAQVAGVAEVAQVVGVAEVAQVVEVAEVARMAGSTCSNGVMVAEVRWYGSNGSTGGKGSRNNKGS